MTPQTEYLHENVKGIHMTFQHAQSRFIIEQVIVRNIYGVPPDLTGKTVIDIGAHIGSFSLLAAQAGATVYAFEPEEENFRLLRDNVAANYGASVLVNRVAISNGSPWQKLYLSENSGSHSLDPHLNGLGLQAPFQTVDTLPFDWIFTEHNIQSCALLKVDCEGGEEYILPLVLSKYADRVEAIAVEFHRQSSMATLLPEMARRYDLKEISHFEWRLTRR